MKYNNKIHKIITISAAVLALLVIFFVWKAHNKPEMLGTLVNVETLKLDTVENTDFYQGSLISRYSVYLQSQVNGQVASINVKPGDKVSKGQTLIVIDPRKQEATLNSSKADASSMNAAINQAQSNLHTYEVQREGLVSNYQTSKKQYERYSYLYSKNTVSQQDLEKYTDLYNKAKADLDANGAQIQSQKAAIKVASSNYQKASYAIKEQSVQLSYYKIVAPYSGTIGDIPIKVGEYITPQSKLLNITQNNQLEINVGLPADKVFQIQKGLPVEILDYNDQIVAASEISFVAPNVDTDTQTILVKAVIQNPKEILKADQSVKLKVIYSKAQGILVPTGAVTHLGGQDFAFVVDKSGKQPIAKQKTVIIGEIQNGKYIVKKGLNSGDCVVTSGIQKIYDGAPVTITQGGNI
ncbi:MAG: efflux RND transporter periplasmic adaptor subunit [Candidatus Gastranaerophilales bacterium]|nr:efflux RND transporter periplasmic adaptor subunit [Candidatus Gastranaerophilales bacterium]